MKVRDLSKYTRHAIDLTHRNVEGRDWDSPTWDGETLHIARIDTEANVIHEVAHWLCTPPDRRACVNYGLGTDPDDGPHSDIWWLTDLHRVRRLFADIGVSHKGLGGILKADPDLAVSLARSKADHEESLAALVTIILLRKAGMKWAKSMHDTFGKLGLLPKIATLHLGEAHGADLFWRWVGQLQARGVDLNDPLAPFARPRSSSHMGVAP